MYHQEIKDLKLSEESLKATVDALKTHMDKFEKEAYNEKRHRIKAEEEYESMKENIENEVGLRMKFEDKVGDHELLSIDEQHTCCKSRIKSEIHHSGIYKY